MPDENHQKKVCRLSAGATQFRQRFDEREQVR
jgi:hypothetical protein